LSEAVKEFIGVATPIKVTKMDINSSAIAPALSKHWKQFDPNYLDADDQVASLDKGLNSLILSISLSPIKERLAAWPIIPR